VYGDSFATGAFSAKNVVVLGVCLVSILGTVALSLSLLGLPLAWSGVAFIGSFAAGFAVAWPLLKRVAPRFDSVPR